MAKFDLSFGRAYDPLDPEDVAAAINAAAHDLLSARGGDDATIKLTLRGMYGSISARLHTLARHVDNLADHPGAMVRPVLAHFSTAGLDLPQIGVPRRMGEIDTSAITSGNRRTTSPAAAAAAFPRAVKRL